MATETGSKAVLAKTQDNPAEDKWCKEKVLSTMGINRVYQQKVEGQEIEKLKRGDVLRLTT